MNYSYRFISYFLLLSLSLGTFFFPSLSPFFADETFEVSLATETQLKPVYVQWISDEKESPYAKRLDRVLRFDLNHNGWLQALESDNHWNIKESVESWSKWRSLGAHYTIHLELTGSGLKARLWDIQSKRNSYSPSWTLSGDFERDRTQIHQLSNWVLHAITGQQGIASSHLIYTLDIGSSKRPRTQILQADYDGANAKVIFEQEALLVTPCYLPQMGSTPTHFALVSYKLGQPKVLFASIGGGFRRATALGGSQLAPTIDPRGTQLAFICDVEGNPDLYWMKIDLVHQKSEAPRRLYSCKRGSQASPTFSPDGKKLAFVSSKDSNPRIYMIEIDNYLKGADPDKALLISRKNRENTCPAWSPNGRYIAYSAKSTGARQIWIYDTQTKTETCLTTGDGVKENPCWASNSLHLFYNQEVGSGCHLFMCDLNTQKSVQISQHRHPTRFPSCSF